MARLAGIEIAEPDEDDPEQIAADQKKLAAALKRFAAAHGQEPTRLPV